MREPFYQKHVSLYEARKINAKDLIRKCLWEEIDWDVAGVVRIIL